MQIIVILGTLVFCFGLFMMWISSEDKTIIQMHVNLIGNRIKTFGALVISICLYQTDLRLWAAIPGVITVTGIILDAFKTMKYNAAIAAEKDNPDDVDNK